MRTPDPRAGKNGISWDATLLSPKACGHWGGSAAFLVVDPETEVLIAHVRNQRDSEFNKYFLKFMQTIHDGLLP